jgi:hypothetical protein
MNGRIYADEQGLECLLVAKSGLFGAVLRESALPPITDMGRLSAKTDSQSFALCPRNGRSLRLSGLMAMFG